MQGRRKQSRTGVKRKSELKERKKKIQSISSKKLVWLNYIPVTVPHHISNWCGSYHTSRTTSGAPANSQHETNF